MGLSIVIALAGAITIVDGDTVEQAGQRWRLVGLDAPEIHNAACAPERELAIRSAARLAALIAERSATLEPLPGKARDKYGRGLARLSIGGEDWAAISVREGLAVAWDGKGRRHKWCAD